MEALAPSYGTFRRRRAALPPAVLALGAVLFLAGCGGGSAQPEGATAAAKAAPSSEAPSSAPPAIARVMGNVTYRERRALPPDAVVTVTLVDLFQSETLGEHSIPTEGRQVPVPFEITYDPSRVAAGGSLALTARIEAGEAVLYASEDAVPVPLPDQAGSVEIVVVPAPEEGAVDRGNSGSKVSGR